MQFKAILLSLVFSSVIASAPLAPAAPKSDVELTETHEGPHDSNLARRAENVLERRQEDHAAHQHHHHHDHAHAQKKKLARRQGGDPEISLARRELNRRQWPEGFGAMGLARRSPPHEGPHDGLARRALKRRQHHHGHLSRRSSPREGPREDRHDVLARRSTKLSRRASTHEGPHDGLARRASTHEGPHDGLARRAINHRDRRAIPESKFAKRSQARPKGLAGLSGGLLNANQSVGNSENTLDAAEMNKGIMGSMIKD